MRRFLAAHPKDKHGAHRYALADAGLDVAAERTRYAGYQERYGISVGSDLIGRDHVAPERQVGGRERETQHADVRESRAPEGLRELARRIEIRLPPAPDEEAREGIAPGHEEHHCAARAEPRAQAGERLDQSVAWDVLEHRRRDHEIVVAPGGRKRRELEDVRLGERDVRAAAAGEAWHGGGPASRG